MKAIGLALIFGCCVVGGIWIDNDQRNRVKELGALIYLFELLKAEIDYQLTPLNEACKAISTREKHSVGLIFESFARQLEAKESMDVGVMWQLALKEHKDSLHLKEKDYEMLKGFGGACGYLDKNMQKRNLEMMIEQVEHERKLSEQQYERCSKLNKSLGIIIGAVLVIFFI